MRISELLQEPEKQEKSDGLSMSSLLGQQSAIKRVPVFGIDPTEQDEADVIITAGDRAKFAVGQFVRGVSSVHM